MQRSPDQGPLVREDEIDIEAIQRKLEGRMHNKHNSSKRFITGDEVYQFGHEVGLRRFFPRAAWKDGEIQWIRKNNLKVLSTLVSMGWHGVCGQEKTEKILGRPIRDREDSELPLAKDGLAFYKEHAASFRPWRYVLCPVVVQEHESRFVQKSRLRRACHSQMTLSFWEREALEE